MRWLRSGGWAGLLLVLSAVWLWAAGANIAPDAVTRATQGYNTYAGELAFLTDGLTPDNSDRAGVFAWPTKGKDAASIKAATLDDRPSNDCNRIQNSPLQTSNV